MNLRTRASNASTRGEPSPPRAGPGVFALRDLRLTVLAVSAWLSAGVIIGLPRIAPIIAILAFTVCIGLLIVTIAVVARARRRARLTGDAALNAGSVVATCAAVAAVVAVTALSVAALDASRHPTGLDRAARSQHRVTAIVEAGPLASGRSWPVTIVSATVGDSVTTASAPALVFDAEPAAAVVPGSRFEVVGTLRATDTGSTVAYLLFAAHPAQLKAEAPAAMIVAEQLRSGLSRAAETLPGTGADLLPGLAIGDTRAVGGALDDAMKASALSHLTAVSGANCAVVVALVMLALGALRVPRAARIATAIVVLAGFVVLVTPEPSVLRAAVMATIALVALGSGRPVTGVVVLSGAVLILVLADPWLARSYGFALSVVATASILVLARPLAAVLSRVMPRALAIVVAVPLAAQWGCQPILILLAPVIPTFGLVANIVAAPAAPVATVLGLIACVVLPLVPWLGQVLVVIAWIPATWIASVAEATASAPGASIAWPAGAAGFILAVVISVATMVTTLADQRRRLRLVAGILAVSTMILVGISAGATRLAIDLARPSNWQIAACDVGQGDAVVFRNSGAVALIDAGPDPDMLAECLSDIGVDRIDLLVVTHFDRDHVGGLPAVAGRVGDVVVGPSAGADDDAIVAGLVSGGARLHRLFAGASGRLGDARWEVLWPVDRLRAFKPGNESSVVVRFVGEECARSCLSATFLGDLGRESQAALLRTGGVAAVDVITVAHHGSASQDPALYAALRARLGIVGVGRDNRYGHPTDTALDTVRAQGTVIHRTDTDGLVLVAPSMAEGLDVWTERSVVRGGD